MQHKYDAFARQNFLFRTTDYAGIQTYMSWDASAGKLFLMELLENLASRLNFAVL